MIQNIDDAISILNEHSLESNFNIPNWKMIEWLKELAYFRKKYPNNMATPYFYGACYDYNVDFSNLFRKIE